MLPGFWAEQDSLGGGEGQQHPAGPVCVPQEADERHAGQSQEAGGAEEEVCRCQEGAVRQPQTAPHVGVPCLPVLRAVGLILGGWMCCANCCRLLYGSWGVNMRCSVLNHRHRQNIGWLNLFNAELSPKRHWWGVRSQEVGEEGDCT